MSNREERFEKFHRLTEEQLENIGGGLVVDGGDGMFYVVDDEDGFIYLSTNINVEYAIWAAKTHLNQSTNVISAAEYEKKFGKPCRISYYD